MSFDLPTNAQLADTSGKASVPFLSWLSIVHTTVVAMRQSGTTANRPTALLWVGRRYFDTDLGLPVYWNGTAWVNGGATMYHGSATLDFPSIASNDTEALTMTVTGAQTGDRVILAAPATLERDLVFSGYVSAANTVTIRLHNCAHGAENPASATWGATVFSV